MNFSNYPGSYPNNFDCHGTISVASVRNIRLTFSHFDVESPFDYVEVYDGPTVSADRRLLKHSGSTAPSADVVSSSPRCLCASSLKALATLLEDGERLIPHLNFKSFIFLFQIRSNT